MRLLTHNLLQCHVKSCTSNNYPLVLSEVTLLNNANDIAIDSSSSDTGSSSNSDDDDFNPEFIENMVQNKLDWNALVMASHSLGIAELPLQMPESLSQDLLRTLHTVLIKTRIKEGKMTCPGCARIFPIINCIPNMLLSETEV